MLQEEESKNWSYAVQNREYCSAAELLKLKELTSISSACYSAHCMDMRRLKYGQTDVIIAGGAEDDHWTSSSLFDAMGALSSKYNDSPEIASRPFDKNRDGFVIAGGSGMLILESEDR